MPRMQNPFPVTPALRLSPFQLTTPPGADFTVVTSATEDARDYVESYLDEADRWEAERAAGAEPPPLSGRVLGVSGDYGSGKTHQLIDIARLVHESGAREHGAKVRLLLLDAPRGGIAAAYRDQLIGQFDPDAIVELLKDYHGDTVAEGVENVPFPPGSEAEDGKRAIARGLRQGELDPEGVTQAYLLSASDIEARLATRLRGVAEHWEFAKALTLMLDPPSRDAAWRWFRGDAPGKELRDNGITASIATESMAYDALAVLAFLHGRRGQRIVFIVDEFEKLLEDTEVGRLASLQAFERLAGVFIDAGCLLVFSASKQAIGRLSGGLRERTYHVSLAPLDRAETERLIEGHLSGLVSRGDEVFPEPTVTCVGDLGEGNPRRVISLCRGGFRLAAARPGGDAEVTVTEDNVRAFAHQEYERFSLPEAVSAARDILQADGWPLPADDHLGSRPPVDFWVDADDAVIAVIVTDSLLSRQDAETLFGRVSDAELRASPQPCQTIIVVNGHVSRSARDAVVQRIGRNPVIHQGTGFGNDFRAALLDAHRRLHNQARRDDLAKIRITVEQILRQQERTQHAIDRLRRRSGARTAAEGADAGPGPSQAGSALPGHVDDDAVAGLPREVLDEFRRARDEIPVDRDIEHPFDHLFRQPGDGERTASPRRAMRRDRFEDIGVIWTTEQLVLAFRDAVARWYAAGPQDGTGRGDAEREEELRHICRMYESAAEDVLPLLFRRHAYTGTGPLEQLGSRVRELLLR